ncbi:MAG: hypothetical protein Q7R35_00750 [Elusimicrobiota bacterium]|nr:hypothetical protein [Elusimicrobiota bacterium]
MSCITKNLFSVLFFIAGISPANAWWDPGNVTDISTTNLYGIPAAMKKEAPELDSFGLIAIRRVSPDRAVVMVGTGGFPWWSGPFGLFLVDPLSGKLIKKIAAVTSIDPRNAMPDLKTAGPGYVTIVHEDVDSGGELARRKYFFDELSTAPATSQSYKPVRINAIARFNDSLYFTGKEGENGVIIRLGLNNEKPAAGDWEIIKNVGGQKLSPIAFSKIESDGLRMYTPAETYTFDGKAWSRIAGADTRYFRPAQEPCSLPMDDLVKYQELYDKCEKERLVLGDADMVGYTGRCETENPGEYAGLPDSYAYTLERHQLSARLIDISKTPLRRFFIWNSRLGYEDKPATGIYEIKSKSCKFYPMPVPNNDILKRYRPEKATQGCDLNDKLGRFQKLGDRIWFCKNFYGGEGQCGVGAAGFFDTKAKVFEVLYSSQTAKWSCSALLAEEKTVWMGLQHIGEGSVSSGGLAAVNPSTGEATIYKVPSGISAIQRMGDSVILGTGEGIYLFNSEGIASFAGPDVDKDGKDRLNFSEAK